jgi:uncharacterized protein involved in exopolysaccharide biosynthesis
MSTPRFDLVDIVQTIRKRFRLVIIVTLVAAVIGVAFHFLRKKEFTAKAQFFVSNPLLSDRNTLYGGPDSRLDYFGDEDDVDRVLALSESDTVIMKVLDQTGLAHEMDKDLIDPKNINDMKEYFMEHMKIKRTEYTMVEVSFSDKSPQRAASIANATVRVIEEAYRSFYNSRRQNIFNSLSKKFAEQDSAIVVLTDTLAVIRDRSGIYGLISPNRLNMVTSSVSGKGGAIGKDIEVIQNIEAIKDGLVIDQTRIASLLQQFSTGTGDMEMELFQTISRARQPIVPNGLSGLLTLIASCLIGFFFSCIYILLSTYYRVLIAVER